MIEPDKVSMDCSMSIIITQTTTISSNSQSTESCDLGALCFLCIELSNFTEVFHIDSANGVNFLVRVQAGAWCSTAVQKN